MGRVWKTLFGLISGLMVLVAASSGPAQAEKRVALVMGNSDYEFVGRLPNPANDASDIAVVLKGLGFEVTSGLDLDYNQMRLALRDFSDEAQGADVALVYYAGHGMEVDNTNYLIPVNAELKSDRDIDFEAIRLDAVVGAVESSTGLKIVLVDACRNNPFLADMSRSSATRSIGRGLARIEAGGVLVGYAARSGTVSQDGDGRNSPYAQALLRYLKEPGLEVGKMFRKVRDNVLSTTDGAQEPFTYGSLPGEDLYLVAPMVASATVPAPFTSVDAQIVSDYAGLEGRESLKDWQGFLDKYGGYADNGLVKLATAKRDALRKAEDDRTRAANRPLWLDIDPKKQDNTASLDGGERKLVQEALNYAGFDVGTPDGEFGPKTLAAISAARLKYGLYPGTQIDAKLIRALPDMKVMAALKSEKAQAYRLATLPDGVEPRLHRVIETVSNAFLKFDYFRGHLYVAVLTYGSTSWETSRLFAQEAEGHLVTISDRAENDFLVRLFSSDPRFLRTDATGTVFGPSIGWYQLPRSNEPSGGWAWVTGEPVTFTNWSPGNPDNYNGREAYGTFFRNGNFRGSGVQVKYWNDGGNGGGNGYIIEVE